MSKPIDHLIEGLKSSLESEIEKNSPSLGRNAIYHKISRIARMVIYRK
jgi:ubiquitin carboxyl-terminal hydrolase 14